MGVGSDRPGLPAVLTDVEYWAVKNALATVQSRVPRFDPTGQPYDGPTRAQPKIKSREPPPSSALSSQAQAIDGRWDIKQPRPREARDQIRDKFNPLPDESTALPTRSSSSAGRAGSSISGVDALRSLIALHMAPNYSGNSNQYTNGDPWVTTIVWFTHRTEFVNQFNSDPDARARFAAQFPAYRSAEALTSWKDESKRLLQFYKVVRNQGIPLPLVARGVRYRHNHKAALPPRQRPVPSAAGAAVQPHAGDPMPALLTPLQQQPQQQQQPQIQVQVVQPVGVDLKFDQNSSAADEKGEAGSSGGGTSFWENIHTATER